MSEQDLKPTMQKETVSLASSDARQGEILNRCETAPPAEITSTPEKAKSAMRSKEEWVGEFFFDEDSEDQRQHVLDTIELIQQNAIAAQPVRECNNATVSPPNNYNQTTEETMPDERLRDFSNECNEVRRKLRDRILKMDDEEFKTLYYRAMTLSEHEAARRVLISTPPEPRNGWQWVPKEPNEDVLHKAGCTRRGWGDMLAAAPPPGDGG